MNIGPNTSVQEIDQIVSQAPEKERCRVYMAALEALESKGEAAPAELKGRVSSLLLNEKERLTDAFIEKMKGLGVDYLDRGEILKGNLGLYSQLIHLTSDQKLEALEAVSELQFITVLHLGYNQLISVPDSIGKLTKLTELHLYDNQLTSVPDWIGELTKLTVLYLFNNQLTSVPESIGKLTNLTQLHLGYNQLTFVPEFIGKLTKLNTLDLSDNELASIPDSIGKLTNLTDLYLGNNQLASVPESIGKLINLTILLLNLNQLVSVPDSIGELTNLTDLYLGDNQLASVPESIGKLINLTYLYLNDNQLTSVPESIGKLTNLTKLHLGGNQLTFVPESIGKLINLTELDLSFNQLTSVPESIGKLTKLTELYLGDNQLTTIPASVTQLKEIEMMTLNENPLLAEGTHEKEWGRRELVDHFEGRLRIDDPNLVRMPADTRVEDVLECFSGINIEGLKECTHPEVPGPAMSCAELLASFEEVVKTLDFDDEGGANYVSYEQLAPDWKVEDDKNNRERIEERLLPKMRGYIKALYGVGLDEEDQRPAMLPFEKDQPEVKKALSFIFRNMQEETDGVINAVRLTQLFNGIFYCHIGQNEALQTIVFGMLGTTVRGDATSVIKHILALKKNEWIQKAVLAKAVGSTQNVHLVNFYRDKLQELLGIVPGKVEPFDKGQDPFSGNEANVLQVFLELFTPERVVQFIRDYTQTLAERTWQRDHFRYLEGKPEKPGPRPTYHPVTNGDLMYLLQKEEYFSPGDFEDPLAVVTDEGLLEVLVQIGILNRMDS